MSSFHPLGGSSADSHPLTTPGLPFHRDDDDEQDAWTPPSLPGETNTRSSFSGFSARRQRNATTDSDNGGTSPLDAPLDPLLHALPAGGGTDDYDGDNGASETAAGGGHHNQARQEFGRVGNGSAMARRDAGERGGRGPAAAGSIARHDGGGIGGQGMVGTGTYGDSGDSRVLSSVHTLGLHSYYVPTFCDACSQLLVGIMQQGLQCDVCRMNLHPECRATPCSADHRCRPPEAIRISAGVDAARLEGVRLRPGYPSPSVGGVGALGGGIGGAHEERGGIASLRDPLDSEWHKLLMHNRQLWVPDSAAAGCMVCSRLFNVVFRRHHCRRCGACMCGGCSHTAVSDKVLSVNQATGVITRISSGEPVRCCTPCTRILDQQLAQALQRKGWGARQGSVAADGDAAEKRRNPALSSSPAAGGGYAASLPSTSFGTESYDGGGFVPPSSAYHARSVDSAGPGGFGNEEGYEGDARRTFEGNGHGVGGGETGRYGRPSAKDVGIDDPLASAGRAPSLPPPSPKYEEPPAAAGGVPSWLGQSTLSTRRAPGGSSSRLRDGEGREEDGGEWGAGVGETDETTDWSTSGSVV